MFGLNNWLWEPHSGPLSAGTGPWCISSLGQIKAGVTEQGQTPAGVAAEGQLRAGVVSEGKVCGH